MCILFVSSVIQTQWPVWEQCYRSAVAIYPGFFVDFSQRQIFDKIDQWRKTCVLIFSLFWYWMYNICFNFLRILVKWAKILSQKSFVLIFISHFLPIYSIYHNNQIVCVNNVKPLSKLSDHTFICVKLNFRSY